MAKHGLSAVERILARIDRRPGPLGTDCWICTYRPNDKGYVQVHTSVGRPKVYAHRAIFEALVGPIPQGAELDHLCRVPTCCNPLHLEPVTHRENIRRGYAVKNAGKTHCGKGHPLAGANVRVGSNGRKICRACLMAERREGKRRRRARGVHWAAA